MNDVKFAFRQLLKNPGFTTVAVLTLALGIGANTAIFSFLNAILLQPLPYGEPDRVVQLWSRNVAKGVPRFGISLPNFQDWKQQSQTFEALAYYRHRDVRLTETDRPEEIASARVSAEFFQVLGTTPLAGRTFVVEEDAPGANKVVVLNHRFWQRRYGGDTNLVGQTIGVEGESYRIVGVMPAGFDFPDRAALWMPYGAAAEELRQKRTDHLARVIGKIRPGISRTEMDAELTAISARLAVAYPEANTSISVHAVELRESIFGTVRPALWMLFGAVAGVLLIACGNVAHLQWVRGVARQQEFIVRSALGASRHRIVRQLVLESLLLSGSGAVLGLGLARLLLPWLAGLAPGEIPRLHEARLDGTVLLFAASLAVGAGTFAGLLPAVGIIRADLAGRLQAASRAGALSRDRRRVVQILVGGELAMAVMLAIGACLLGRSLHRLETVELGFAPESAAATRLRLPWTEYHPDGRDARFFEELRRRMEAQRGVRNIGMVCVLPTMESGVTVWVKPPGDTPRPGEEWTAKWNYASPGYFAAMGIPLLAGRDLSEQDTPQAPLVMVISEPLARHYFRGENPLGRQLLVEGQEDKRFTIVGVVAGTRNLELTQPAKAEVYFSHQQVNVASAWVVIRHELSLPALEQMLQGEVRALDPSLPVWPLQTVSAQLGRSTQLPRFRALLLATMAGMALVLATIGVCGVVAHSVALRQREFGVRLALGGQARDILRLVLSEGGRIAVAGVALGLALAAALSRILRAMLFEIQPLDAYTFTLVPAAAFVLALAVCALPAWRAARVDPMVALRSE